ncbi:hypothetical protein VIN01S_21190 [Vibrio inusitatus NBRC 102082]|uniref:Polysaccharide pyruvyl transferase domain-containing protein n=1 Tax=Vibrio inusitatus NBRC 102082 TaxID=1219070 RepID=A0A4Y3HWC5_9VIBR|nr:polysaccharide pyruvyl transferase family protein [Vibrio inusitatus]GEA51315.1 hypothetical protein VIN01S_21190 [Vibrio inusitatus NBRC 102082]
MKLEYCRSKSLNVGDDLNPWLWPKLFGDDVIDIDSTGNSQEYLVGIGTLLTAKRFKKDLASATKIHIFSSGAWEGSAPPLDDRCVVHGVRGPRTAKKLGISEEKVIGDGAYLISTVDYPKSAKIEGRIGFVPHHKSEDFIGWQSVCEKAGLHFISPKQPVDDFLVEIQQCERVIAEAMHGAIIADVLRVPWLAVSYSPIFSFEKWYDFAEALDMDINIHTIPFEIEKRLPLGKTIENALSNLLSRNENKYLPARFKTSSPKNIEHLIDTLKNHKNSEFNLSSDESYKKTVFKQINAMEFIKRISR